MNKKLLSVLVLGVFVFSLVVPMSRVLAQTSGLSIEDLQKQIYQLTELIKNLQAQLNNLRGQTQPVKPVMPEQGWEKISGVISSLVGTFQQENGVTHQISLGGGSGARTYLVKPSNNEILGLLNKYIGQNVTLWGQFYVVGTDGAGSFIAYKVYPEGYSCAVPASARIGYTGDDVKVVQKYLATDKTIYPEGLVTGYYGALTKKAVERYQQKNGLVATGEVSGVTAEKLEIAVESAPTFVCPVPPKPIPPPVPDPNQGLKVYSPSTGETWVPGQTYKIAWSQIWPTIVGPGMDPSSPNAQLYPATAVSNTSFAPIGAVRITLHKYISCLYPEKPTDPVCMIAEVMPYVIAEKTDNDGVFEWTVPADVANGMFGDGKVIVRVSSVDGRFSGRSGVFAIGSGTITPPPATSVKVYSPSNGESWFMGQTYKIAWTSATGFGQMGPVTIYLTRYQEPCPMGAACAAIGLMPYTIAKGVENTGTFVWAVPKDLGTGYQGKVMVMVQGTDGSYGKSEVFSILPGAVTSNLPPVVSGVSGPTNLKTGETGTWMVKAYDPENGSLSYSVLWGDESIMALGAPSPFLKMEQNNATFTHVYNQAGTFAPVFYVTDDKGQQAKTSMSVVVGGGVTVNKPPVINTFQFQNGVTQLSVGQMYALNYLATDPEGLPVKYTIDWGDGTVEGANSFAVGTTGTSLHTYATAGTKNLKLIATDSAGLTASQSLTVNVVAQNIDYQILNFNQGWNFISFYRLPDGRDLRNIFTDPYFGYVDVIKTIENGQEQAYDRANNINTLQKIQFDNGYKVYANRAFSMYVYGSLPTQAERTTHLVRGLYNLVGYPSVTSRKVDQVFSSSGSFINAMISSVKDAAGNLWAPGYPNWIGEMKPGQGYEVWINPEFTNNQDIDFTFPQ